MAAVCSISALLGSTGTNDLIARATLTFRGVRCDALEQRHMATNTPAAEAFKLSTKVPLGSIDAFIDPNGREPILWIDRCCIDPTELVSQLPCLPIYLAGCDSLLALRGPTFLSRLWCVELYVFFEMGHDISRITIVDFSTGDSTSAQTLTATPADSRSPVELPSPIDARAPRRIAVAQLQPPGGARPSELRVSASAAAAGARFDVRVAKCTTQEDEDKLLAVIETCGAGADTFNEWMAELLLLAEADRATASKV